MKKVVCLLLLTGILGSVVSCSGADDETQQTKDKDIVSIKETTTEEITEEETTVETTTAPIDEIALLSDGPFMMQFADQTSGEFTLYQYSEKTGSFYQVFHFMGKYKIPNDTKENRDCGYTKLGMHEFRRQIFDTEFERMAISWNVDVHSERHVGWVDREGNVTDVSAELHGKTNDFTSTTPWDQDPLFDSKGRLVFFDKNEGVFCCYDPLEKKIVETYEKGEYDPNSLSAQYWLDRNDIPCAGTFQCKEGILVETDGFSGGYNLAELEDGTVLFKILYISEITASKHGTCSYIYHLGAGVTEITEEDGEKYYVKATLTSGGEEGEPITPESDWDIFSMTYFKENIYFLAKRDSEQALFKMSYKNKQAGTPEYVMKLDWPTYSTEALGNVYGTSIFSDDRDIEFKRNLPYSNDEFFDEGGD